jgi:hypothetical protein
MMRLMLVGNDFFMVPISFPETKCEKKAFGWNRAAFFNTVLKKVLKVHFSAAEEVLKRVLKDAVLGFFSFSFMKSVILLHFIVRGKEPSHL